MPSQQGIDSRKGRHAKAYRPRPKINSAMSSPTISVIIPCFNHGEFLPEAVESITAVKRDDVELIVVDDGSTDERTRAEMDALIAREIRVIKRRHLLPYSRKPLTSRPAGSAHMGDDRSEHNEDVPRQVPSSDSLNLHWVAGSFE